MERTIILLNFAGAFNSTEERLICFPRYELGVNLQLCPCKAIERDTDGDRSSQFSAPPYPSPPPVHHQTTSATLPNLLLKLSCRSASSIHLCPIVLRAFDPPHTTLFLTFSPPSIKTRQKQFLLKGPGPSHFSALLRKRASKTFSPGRQNFPKIIRLLIET